MNPTKVNMDDVVANHLLTAKQYLGRDLKVSPMHHCSGRISVFFYSKVVSALIKLPTQRTILPEIRLTCWGGGGGESVKPVQKHNDLYFEHKYSYNFHFSDLQHVNDFIKDVFLF
jgi:hypothetical protein